MSEAFKVLSWDHCWNAVFKRIRAVVFLLLLNFLYVAGQNPVYRHFTPNNGLESSTVYSCVQDKEGYMWFATESGVNRFNGRTFESFSVDEGLADSEIFRVFQDMYGRIWFLSYNGYLSFYLDGKIYNPSNTAFLNEAYCGQSILEMHQDKKGRLWVNTSGTFVFLIENEMVLKFDFKSDSLKGGGVNVIINNDGSAEFRTKRNIFTFDETTKKMKLSGIGKNVFFLQRPTRSETTQHFEIITDGILLFDNQKEELILKGPKSEIALYYTTVYNEKNGNFWVGTLESGVELYQWNNGNLQLVKKLLPDIQVSDIVKDNEGSFWICTKDDGVYMIPAFGKSVSIYTRSETFPTRNIFSVFVDSKKRIWTGGDRGYVTCIDSAGNIINNLKLTKLDKNNSRVIDIAEDSVSNIWMITNYNTYKIDKTGKSEAVFSTNASFVGPRAGKAIAVDKKGDVYVAYFAGIIKYNKKLNSFDMLPNQGYPKRTFFVHSGMNRLFVANVDGLCEYKNDSLMPLYLNDPRLRQRISSICNVDDSTLAIGTNGHGVYFYRNDTIYKQLNTLRGLPSNDCRHLVSFDDNLSIVTDKGLANYYFKWDKVIVNEISHAINGFYGNDVRDEAISRDKIYYATSNGLVVVNKQLREVSKVIPRVLFLKLIANENVYTLDSSIVLKYDENNIQINFEAISFSNPEHLKYEYQVGNEYAEWKQTEAGEVLLPKLPPGNYNFLVRAKLDNGTWGPPSTLSFEIMKPFWQTYGFKIFSLLLIIASVSLPFYLIYKKRLRDKWVELDKLRAVNRERQRISYDLHDELGSSLTSITMNAEIIKQKQTKKIDFNKELEDIVVYSRDANEKMSDIVWAISVSNDHLPGLASYINEFITDFENRTGIQCIKKIEDQLLFVALRPEVRKNLFLAVKEAFHNVQKHARAQKVMFELFVLDQILNISIRDDGKGIEKSKIQDSSMGLISMQKRMDSIHGNIIIMSELNEGTEVILRFNLIETSI